MKQHIEQMIVVEGKNDTFRLKQYFDCDTIETDGGRLDESVLALIREAAVSRGVIVFTDPDGPGERLRRRIRQEVPEVQEAFIPREKARTIKKVGVEHAERAALEAALAHVVRFREMEPTLSWGDFVDLGLVGDAALRNRVCALLHVGPCNGKTCFKRLNQLQIDREQLERLVKENG